MGSIRRECLDHMIIFSIAGLRRLADTSSTWNLNDASGGEA